MSDALAAYETASHARRAADDATERIDVLERIVAGMLYQGGDGVRSICKMLSWSQTPENFNRIRWLANRYE